jgi:ubiquinone/menaquinone biosynthesis C-methylase UbiE
MDTVSRDQSNPWEWMQPHDVERMGAVIMDPKEQQRWCRAVMLGGLPYMWRVKAKTVREMAYDRLGLRTGDKVLIIGESVASCGFVDDIRERIGPSGDVRVIDITEEARDAYFVDKRGRNGALAAWQFTYTADIPDGAYDCVAVLQAVQHCDDWRETGAELLRIMKPGRSLVLAEITFSPKMLMAASLDLHIEYWIEKIFAGVGFNATQFSYYSSADLARAFAGLVNEPGEFVWNGVELFWGTKP